MSDELAMMPISATRREVLAQPEVVAGVVRDQAAAVRELAQVLAARGTRHVALIGSGDSWFAGMACRMAFEQYAGVAIEALQAYEYAAYGHAAFDTTTAAVLISSSGRPTTTWDALDRALATPAYVIGITDNPYAGNPFSEKVHTALIPRGAKVGWPAQTTTATIAVLIALAIELGRARGHLADAVADQLTTELHSTVDAMAEALKRGDAWAAAHVPQLLAGGQRRIYTFVGSGPGLGVAYNGMALLGEGPQEVGIAITVEEFHHGLHIATIAQEDVVVLIAPSGAADSRLLDTARSVTTWGSRLLALVGPGDTAIRALAADLLELPAAPEPMTPLLYLMPLHQLSIHLAQQKVDHGYARPQQVP
ncbi:MAG TPA: SIS domain-containing protein [Roseiflexaceae bacterium]|nr:SIS domain-containing protein [Roseiflexaceae bacterium]